MNAQNLRDRIETLTAEKTKAEQMLKEATEMRCSDAMAMAITSLKSQTRKTIEESTAGIEAAKALLVKAEAEEARRAEEKKAQAAQADAVLTAAQKLLDAAGIASKRETGVNCGNRLAITLPRGMTATARVDRHQKSDGWRTYGPVTVRIQLSFDYRMHEYGYKDTFYAALDKNGQPKISGSLAKRVAEARDMLIAQVKNAQIEANRRNSDLALIQERLPEGMVAEEITESHRNYNHRGSGSAYYETKKIVIKRGEKILGSVSHKDGKFTLHLHLSFAGLPGEDLTDVLEMAAAIRSEETADC